MRKLFVLLLFAPLVGVAQKADFSGRWSLNNHKTDFKQVPDYVVPVSFDIKQKKDGLVIQTKIFDKESVQHYYSETIPLDGSTNEILLYNDNRRSVSLRWGINDSAFIMYVKIIHPDNPAGTTYTETWTLENGGKTLVVDRVAPVADEYSIKAFYDKK